MDKSKIVLIFIVVLALGAVVTSESNIINLRDILTVKIDGVTPEVNGGFPVNIQDQTTRPIDIRANQIYNDTLYSLATTPVPDEYNLTLNTTTGLIVGDKLAFLEQNGDPQLFFGEIQAINANVITMDSPVPYNFTPSNTFVFEFNNDMSVDGSTNKQIFSIVNFFDEQLDITRFIFHCTDNVAMDDSLFCGLEGLPRGVTLRKKLINGKYINYFNVKTNGEWSELAFDKSYDDKAPSGFYGFTTRLSYAGQDKHGVAIRLDPGESIEFLVQDDLTDLENVGLMVEGHFVQNGD